MMANDTADHTVISLRVRNTDGLSEEEVPTRYLKVDGSNTHANLGDAGLLPGCGLGLGHVRLGRGRMEYPSR